MSERWAFTTRTMLWDANPAMHLATVPEKISDEIEFRSNSGVPRAGFGSVRVEATVGATTWRTSLFPDSHAGTYVLPVKKEVRSRESIDLDEAFKVTVRLIDAP